jgi:hypothetical protein
MRKGTLYFHSNCFDGLVSAVLTWVFLETKSWHFQEFLPVNYDLRTTWLSDPLKAPAAVVDFLYHPGADFWVDHHPTTFLTTAAKDDFEKRSTQNCLLYDPRAGSCASLLWKSFHSCIPNAERYRDAVSWAEKIDTANYASVDEAIWGDSPALLIKHTLSVGNEPSYYRFLLSEMRSGELSRIAELAPVAERSNEVRQRIGAGIERVRECARLMGDVAVMDFESSSDDIVSRYAPYHFFPKARYSISVLRSAADVRISTMRNPWINFRSIPLGKIMEAFGGGGHERVGSVLIPKEKSDQTNKVVDRLLAEMQSQSPIESVTV